jgi:hypothetical protein
MKKAFLFITGFILLVGLVGCSNNEKNNNRYDFDWGYVLEYKMGEHYFYVSINENTINLWGISKYKYDYKGN